MLFNSAVFLFAFLPIVWTVYIFSRTRHLRFASVWLLASSLVFHAWLRPEFTALMVFSIVVNYAVARLIGRGPRRTWLIFGLAFNFLLLGYFKYTNFFIQTINGASGAGLPLLEIALPLGISFFTFQQVAFLIDTYRGHAKGISAMRYALFITYFPQLIAGPIVHHNEFIPQLDQTRHKTGTAFAEGVTMLIIGLFKKVVIADTMALKATPTFVAAANGHVLGLFDAWAGVLCYAMQIYFDFSAYSDMAIGLGRMFGFDLPINFASPYKARSISDFWRRWHVTLSRFLRDYLYIPLGGSRLGLTRTQFNLMATMVLGGFWHGAAWTFVLWGAMHGTFLLINYQWRQRQIMRGLDDMKVWQGFSWALTFACVLFAWVPFRSSDLASTGALWRSMLGLSGIGSFDQGAIALAGILLVPFVVLAPNAYEFMAKARLGTSSPGYPATCVEASVVAWQPTIRWAVAMAFLIVLVLLKINDASEFIYFQF